MLKLGSSTTAVMVKVQPPSGGCVLKLQLILDETAAGGQPPSGGCVLKQIHRQPVIRDRQPAAFRRLCVETVGTPVESSTLFPAAFRRLCVETFAPKSEQGLDRPSRLQAAVC